MTVESSKWPELQELRQRGYHTIANEIAQARERWDYWLQLRRASPSERYFRHKHGLHLHLAVGINSERGVTHKYCIHFQLSRCYVGGGNLCNVPVSVLQLDESDMLASNEGVQDEAAVLVDAVKFMDLPEGVRPVGIPSMVRLQRLDDCLSSWRDTSDLSRFFVGIHRSAVENREFRSLDLLASDAGGISFRKSEREMVERRPEIVNTVSDNEAQAIRDSIDTGDSKSAVTGGFVENRILKWVRVWFVNDSIRFTFDPGLDLCLEALQVLTRPIELEPNTIGGAHVGLLSRETNSNG